MQRGTIQSVVCAVIDAAYNGKCERERIRERIQQAIRDLYQGDLKKAADDPLPRNFRTLMDRIIVLDPASNTPEDDKTEAARIARNAPHGSERWAMAHLARIYVDAAAEDGD